MKSSAKASDAKVDDFDRASSVLSPERPYQTLCGPRRGGPTIRSVACSRKGEFTLQADNAICKPVSILLQQLSP